MLIRVYSYAAGLVSSVRECEAFNTLVPTNYLSMSCLQEFAPMNIWHRSCIWFKRSRILFSKKKKKSSILATPQTALSLQLSVINWAIQITQLSELTKPTTMTIQWMKISGVLTRVSTIFCTKRGKEGSGKILLDGQHNVVTTLGMLSVQCTICIINWERQKTLRLLKFPCFFVIKWMERMSIFNSYIERISFVFCIRNIFIINMFTFPTTNFYKHKLFFSHN